MFYKHLLFSTGLVIQELDSFEGSD